MARSLPCAFACALAVLLAGCLGGQPRRATAPEGRGGGVEAGEPLLMGREAGRKDDKWSVDAMLPRSGDPARPNVKVELSVVDVRSSRGLFVSAGVRGSLVRGVVNLRATLSARSRSGRARSRSAQMIVVQAGHVGTIQVSRQLGPFVGPHNALSVFVAGVDANGAVDLDIAPYTSTTSVPGEQLHGATRVRVLPGQAVVVGGLSSSYDAEGRSLGGYRGASGSRETLVLLSVDVLG